MTTTSSLDLPALALGVPDARADSAVRVLTVLRTGSPAAAGDVVAATGLSRPTVLTACDDLVAAGWVREVPGVTSGRGRPARTFEIDPDAGFVAGVDLGLGRVRVAIADLAGRIRHSSSVAISPTAGGRARIGAINKQLSALRAKLPEHRLLAVAIGLPAPVHGAEIIADEDFLGDLPRAGLSDKVARAQGAPVVLHNDANLAALAERAGGVAQGSDNLVALLAGERLGAGVVCDGRLLHGSRGGAGEIGGAGLLRGVEGTLGVGYLVRQAAAPRGMTDPATVFDLATKDVATRRLVERAVRPVARVIASLHLLLDPEVIVISGAVAGAPGLIAALEAGLPQMEELQRRPVTLRASTLGGTAVVHGGVAAASSYAWERLLARP
ncbi:ROK family transcriptional regulator [Flexivirga meconopsidis]|uniref:ROK family transcriptional regulator n=1 Tax=Flexivirga meconopsidis TaxID=2977121 RepID=UPI00223F2579|nr:ROK family transcriptional regulator [Flexivirga meconopsidis]